MQFISSRWLVLTTLALTASLLAACGAKQNGNGDQVLYRYALQGNPGSLDAQRATGGVWESELFLDTYGTLYAMDADGLAKPALAESYDVSDDGLTYTFHLKKNLKWSDGEPFSAEDVLFSFRRMSQQNGVYSTFFSGKLVNYREVTEGKAKPEEIGVETPDPHTVVFHLVKPVPYLVTAIAGTLMGSILPKHYVEAKGDDWIHTLPIPTMGAFQITEFTPDDHITAVKNPNFFAADEVAIDKIHYDIISDSNAAFSRFANGEIDGVALCEPRDKEKAKKHGVGDDEFITAPALFSYFYLFNYAKKDAIYQDVRVRQAMNLAVERQVLIDNIRPGTYRSYSVTPYLVGNFIGKPIYEPAYADMKMEERIQKAQALMKAAGYGPNHHGKVSIRYNTLDTHKQIAVTVAGMFQKIYIDVTLINSDVNTHYNAIKSGDFEMGRAGWSADYNDAQTFLSLFDPEEFGKQYGDYNNPEFLALFRQSNHENDPAKRNDILYRANAMFSEDYGLLPLIYYTSCNLVSKRFTGFKINSMDRHPHRFLKPAAAQ